MSHSIQLQSYDQSHKKDVFHPCPNLKLVPVKCLDVYDGDTCKLAFHLFNDPNQPIIVYSCRLDGIDTPEMKSKVTTEKEMAIKARDFIRERCLNKCVYAHFLSDIHEKYGRLMILLFDKCEENPTFENSLNNQLIELKYANKYDGGTKLDF